MLQHGAALLDPFFKTTHPVPLILQLRVMNILRNRKKKFHCSRWVCTHHTQLGKARSLSPSLRGRHLVREIWELEASLPHQEVLEVLHKVASVAVGSSDKLTGIWVRDWRTGDMLGVGSDHMV